MEPSFQLGGSAVASAGWFAFPSTLGTISLNKPQDSERDEYRASYNSGKLCLFGGNEHEE